MEFTSDRSKAIDFLTHRQACRHATSIGLPMTFDVVFLDDCRFYLRRGPMFVADPEKS